MRKATRVLCLGNDLLGDDALGHAVAQKLQQASQGTADVAETPLAGLNLLDCIQGVSRLVVVDTVLTGQAPPGTIRLLREADIQTIPGSFPHSMGLMETLEFGRKLGYAMPEEVFLLTVEAADCSTVGGAMHAGVRDAIPVVVEIARSFVADSSCTSTSNERNEDDTGTSICKATS